MMVTPMDATGRCSLGLREHIRAKRLVACALLETAEPRRAVHTKAIERRVSTADGGPAASKLIEPAGDSAHARRRAQRRWRRGRSPRTSVGVHPERPILVLGVMRDKGGVRHHPDPAASDVVGIVTAAPTAACDAGGPARRRSPPNTPEWQIQVIPMPERPWRGPGSLDERVRWPAPSSSGAVRTRPETACYPLR
jgi:hypothetical protein